MACHDDSTIDVISVIIIIIIIIIAINNALAVRSLETVRPEVVDTLV